jgi:septum formation protein
MGETNPQLYLASKSPRRRELLDQLGLRYAVVAAEVDEAPWPEERPEDYVMRLAIDKAGAARGLTAGAARPPLLAADTAVAIDGQILGKPSRAEEAAMMLRRLSGRTHRVLSAVAVAGREQRSALSVSEVSFRPIDAAEIRAYWRTGEPLDKAGGYAIQGLGALFVRELRGSYSGVMGLPLYETSILLAAEGVEILGARGGGAATGGGDAKDSRKPEE